MMRRIIMIVMTVMLVFTTACTRMKNTANGELIKPNPESSRPEISILLSTGDEELLRASSINEYINKFEERCGVKVKLISVGNGLSSYYIGNQILTNDAVDKYKTELAAEMYKNGGPELLLYSFISLDSLIRQDAAADVKGKLPNIDKLYPGLAGDKVYYVPFALYSLPIVLNGSCIKEVKAAEPEFSWTKEDYFSIKEKWLETSKKEFTSVDFLDLTAKQIFPIEIFNQDKSKVKINSEKMLEAVKSVRTEIFSDKFLLNQNYSYQNYYNMLFDRQTEEYGDDRALIVSNNYTNSGLRNIRQEYKANALCAGDTTGIYNVGNIVLPNVIEDEVQIFSHGFMLNKNSENLELAYEFLNGLLDDDVQMEIYKDEILSLYPVNKDIEDDIRSLEKSRNCSNKAIQLSQYLLKLIENEGASLSIERNDKEQQIRWMLIKDLTKLIFADSEYTDAELSKELQKLEDKYNIYLSE